METYISILRGINVSGQKKVEMVGLKALFEELKFQSVKTYIQSGNVIFKTREPADTNRIGKAIEKAIFEKYYFHVPVIVRTLQELQTVISNNPFLEKADTDVEKLHVTFLAEKPQEAKITAIENGDYLPDEFVIKDKEVYVYCPAGYGNTKLNNNFFENKLKVAATTRNWRTVNKLFELAAGD
jgi:uncharacterized protein (DUF1697 family)